jgi:homoserine dehydrogenase
MEINDDHIIELIKGQSATTQAVNDLKAAMEKGFIFIHGEHEKLETRHEKLEDRVSGTERKVWYSAGIGSGLGAAAGFIAAYFHGK